MEISRADLVDFVEELTIELYYLAGESDPQAGGTILGFAVTLDRIAGLLKRRSPSVAKVGEFAT